MASLHIIKLWSRSQNNSRLHSLLLGGHVYLRMPFGLTNAGATFQRAMDVAFVEFIKNCLVVYQDEFSSHDAKQ